MSSKVEVFQNLISQNGFNLFACGNIDKISLTSNFFSPGFKGIMIVGNGGADFWKFFLKEKKDGHENPIDKLIINDLEKKLTESGFKSTDFQRFYPHSDYTPPLLQISRHFNLSRPSKLGLDINPEFGPWFGLRALFLFKKALPEISPNPFESPCDRCSLKPCLKSCPGNVFKNGNFNPEDCQTFRFKKDSPCEDKCDARIACPIGKEHQYSKEQMSYHYKYGLKMLKKLC